jgi:hypothetical protein
VAGGGSIERRQVQPVIEPNSDISQGIDHGNSYTGLESVGICPPFTQSWPFSTL